MRPRFMNRGSAMLCFALLPNAKRFNEAPIHESGKCPYEDYRNPTVSMLQ